MHSLTVQMPRVHMAGTEALHDAHLEVGSHGFALFLSPDAPLPLLDIDGSPGDLRTFVRELSAALDVADEHARVRARASLRPLLPEPPASDQKGPAAC